MLNPSREHTALSATVLLMTAVMLSRVIGFLREAYIAWAFGAGRATDAYVAAFQIPDFLNYILAGGTISTTFITIYSRFLAEKREEAAQKTFSVILTVMTTVLVVLVIVTEIFTPTLTALVFPHFDAAQQVLCVQMTRILLPAQVFFYVGGVVSAVLLSRRLFLIPSMTPLVYNLGIIAGGVALAGAAGIHALAIGALVGAFLGPFLMNAVGARRTGIGFRPSFDIGDEAFRRWIRLTIPLMLGVSLVSADDWIIRYFASAGAGDIARLNYAKRLFSVPMAVLGQAVGQASLPFFARLFGEKRLTEFAASVNDSVYRISAASFLASAWMMATALPIIDLVYRRGHFDFSDSTTTGVYFFWFSISLAFWSAQGLYSRGFYAANDTLTPMIACTAITVVSVPIYSALFRTLSVFGLAIASDIGIVANTVVLALLLHRRGLVPLGGMRWRELGKALLVATAAGAAGMTVARWLPLDGSRTADLVNVGVVSIVWAAVCAAGLLVLRSDLPRELRRRGATRTP